MTPRKRATHTPEPPVATGEGGLYTSQDLFGDVVDAPPAQKASRADKTGPVKVRVADSTQAEAIATPSSAGGDLPPEVAALLDVFGDGAESKVAEAPHEADGVDVDRLLDAFSGPAEAALRGDAPPPVPKPQQAPAPPPMPPPVLKPRLPEVPPDPPPLPALTSVEQRVRERLEPDWDSLIGTESPEPAAPAPDVANELLGVTPPPDAGAARPASEAAPTSPASYAAPAFDDVVDTLLGDLGAPPEPIDGEEDLDSALGELASQAAPAASAMRTPSSSRSRTDWRNDRYGPYQLLDRIAVGGMAEVFKARYEGVEGFEKIVAVKRILPHLSDNPEFVEMFVAEAKMVAGLSHANIVQIHDLGRIESSYFIAMEYVHGRDLRSILRRTREKGMRMPLDLSLLIVREVCGALDYAHRKRDERGRPMRIVHRDVSPQNILISFEGDVKLADFGIAKAATKASSTEGGALRGKLMYMSPEQAWGQPMDGRSDMFSLGLVLYEMVTDVRPFVSTSEMSILEMVRACRIRSPREAVSRLPESLDRAILRALAKDVDDRYQDAGEMGRALDRVFPERHLPSAADLAHYLTVLYDLDERDEAIPDDLFPTHPSRRELRLEENQTPPAGEVTPSPDDNDDFLAELGLD